MFVVCCGGIGAITSSYNIRSRYQARNSGPSLKKGLRIKLNTCLTYLYQNILEQVAKKKESKLELQSKCKLISDRKIETEKIK